MVTPRIHPKYLRSAELGQEITELCGYLYAATYVLLVKIREFDRDGLWQLEGIHSCAHWLNWKCGIGMNAAREKVRVANALGELPKISEAFSKGKVSYSKVRAMTRIATPKNEDYLLMIAIHGTAYHIESLVARYRRCERLKDSQNAVRQQESRETWYTYDHDGSLVFHGRLPPGQGALVLKALEKAVQRADGEVSADKRPRVAYRAFMADALVELAESYLEHGCESSSTADRYQVVVHVSAETLRGDDGGVSAETPVVESGAGSPAVRALQRFRQSLQIPGLQGAAFPRKRLHSSVPISRFWRTGRTFPRKHAVGSPAMRRSSRCSTMNRANRCPSAANPG